jgi:homeobox-leucine zipper protein
VLNLISTSCTCVPCSKKRSCSKCKSNCLSFLLASRTKLKQTEVDCEVLKRCCENLSEENRRLQKELQELRALKLAVVATTPAACTAAAVIAAHGFSSYMQRPVLSAATLTMCPSCERVATVENRSAHITFPKPAGSSSSFSHFLQPSAAC